MQNLKLLRKNRNLTQKELGKILGLAESTISLYESGKRQPDNDSLRMIADYFEVSIDFLLDRTGNIFAVAQEDASVYASSPVKSELMELIHQFDGNETADLLDYAKYIMSKRD